MQTWNRPDPLTRDLIHLINARRHDHWDVDAALDTLAELIEVGREDEILTVLAALDEDMAEWLFDLLAEAASTTAGAEGEAPMPQELGPEEQAVLLAGLQGQCGDLAAAPHLLEAPVYAAYALFDAKNTGGLQRLADETIAVWRELGPEVRGRVMVHLHTQCGNGVYMPVWTDLLDPDAGEEAGPLWTSPDVWVFTADLPIEWPGEVLTNRLMAEGCTRFENHIVEAPEN